MAEIASVLVLKPGRPNHFTQPPSRGEKAHTHHFKRAVTALRRVRRLLISAKKQATEPSILLIVEPYIAAETYKNHQGMEHLPFAGTALRRQCAQALRSLAQAQLYASFSVVQAPLCFFISKRSDTHGHNNGNSLKEQQLHTEAAVCQVMAPQSHKTPTSFLPQFISLADSKPSFCGICLPSALSPSCQLQVLTCMRSSQ